MSQNTLLLRRALLSITGSAPPPTPTDILDQVFLPGTNGAVLDPSDLSTMFQDAAKTIPVTASGDPVRVMLDARGLGYEFVAPDDAHRPIWQQGASEGFSFDTPYLAFDGNKSLIYSGTALNFGQISLWCRAESTTTGRWTIHFPHAATHTWPYSRLSHWNSSSRFEGRHNSAVTTGPNTVYGSGRYNMLGNDPINGKLWRNYDTEVEFTPESSITYPNNQGVIVGANASDGERLIGKFFGAVIISRATTQSDAEFFDVFNNPDKKIFTDRNSVYTTKRYAVTKFARVENHVFTVKRYVVTKFARVENHVFTVKRYVVTKP